MGYAAEDGLSRAESRTDRGLRSRALKRPWRLAAVLLTTILLPIGLATAAVSTAPSGQRDWYWQNPVPQGNTLNAVTARGGSDAWAVGAPGIVLRTRDRGRVWEAQDAHTASALNGVDFQGAAGWAVGDGGTIRVTADAGDLWTTENAGTTADLFAISMADASTGWIVGDGGTILGTTNGGTDWTPQTSGTTERLNAVSAAGGGVWAAGDAGTLLHSVDGGTTWDPITVTGVSRLTGVCFVDGTTGWVVGDADGGDSVVRKTTDGGVTWTPQTVAGGRNLSGVAFADAASGWVVGAGGLAAYTSDGGVTWTTRDAGTASLRSAAAWDANSAVTVGVNGRMLTTSDAGANWSGASAATTASLSGIAFLDSDKGIAVGAGGTIAYTGDGGARWQPLGLPLTADLESADATDGTFWAAGDGGMLLRSANGTEWAQQSTTSTAGLRHVDAVDQQHAWAVGDGATILGTTDGGATPWTAQAFGLATSVDLNGVSFADDQYGWAVGGAAGASATVVHTADGGATPWTPQDVGAGDTILRAVSFVDRDTGWVVGDGGLVKHTVDGGSTWTTQDAGTGAPLFAVVFTDALNGWVAGGVGGGIAEVRHTTDGGATWTSVPPGTGDVIRSLSFLDAERGWAAGDGGAILRTTDPGAPSTTLAVSPGAPDGDSGWYVSTPTVTLSADKPGITYYRGDNGPLSAYDSPFQVTAEGTHTVDWFTVDTAGTRETTRTLELHVDRGAPTAPTGLAAAPASSTIAAVSWSPATDAVSGMGHYRVTIDGTFVTDVAGTAATLPNLTPEATYVIGVRAVDAAGNLSSEATTSVQLNATLPRPPAVVYARLAARNQVYVDWNEPTATVGPVSYSVWRSVDDGPYQRIGGTNGTLARSFVDTTAPDPVTLTYGVVVTDDRGTGSLSAPGSIFDSVLTAGPPAPPHLRAVATSQGVETSWTPPATVSAVTYGLLRADTPTSTPTTVTPAGLSATTWRDATVVGHNEYWYRAVSVDASGEAGPLSEPVYVRAETTGPPGPHANFKKVDDPCALCHSAHTAEQKDLLRIPGDSELPLCYSCHDGTSASNVLAEFSDPDRLARHDVTAGPMPGGLTCAACHDPHGAGGSEATGSLLYVQGQRNGDAVCYGCHTATTTPVPFGDLRMFEQSGHATGVPDPTDDSKVKCLACHGGHSDRMDAMTLYASDDRCLRCHSVDGDYARAADIKSALAGPGPETRHDLLASDQAATGSRIACNNCHEPHSSSLATPLVDPGNPSTTGGWSGSSTDFCLRCHGVALPSSADTTPWAAAPLASTGATLSNVASGWPASFHGGGATLANAHLRTDMGWVPGDRLTCLDCHDAHGSLNRWTLRTSIPSRSGTPTVDGLLVKPVGSVPATDPASGADFRFVCSGCHDLTPANHPGPAEGGADLSVFPIDCTASGCHTHAGAGL